MLSNFNPRSLTGATKIYRVQTVLRLHFNPRSLTGATMLSRHTMLTLRFQSTLPYGSDFCSWQTFISSKISIHAPLRERLLFHYPEDFVLVISIHAPLRERRAVGTCENKCCTISIHAPLRERLVAMKRSICWKNFNPRSLTGATYQDGSQGIDHKISIHAPLRERLT